MTDHQFNVLMGRLGSLNETGERLIKAMNLLAEVVEDVARVSDPYKEESEEDKPERPKAMAPPGRTIPLDGKAIPHVDVVENHDNIVLLFEEGVPMELRNFIRRRLDEKYIGLHMSQARPSQIETEINFMLVDMAQYGIVLRARVSGRVWVFAEDEAKEWARQKDNPPSLEVNPFNSRGSSE